MNPMGGLDPPRIHRVGSTLVYSARDESLGAVDPPMIHLVDCTLV